MKWEYDIESFTEWSKKTEIEYLQEKGEQEWELCYVTDPVITDSSHRVSRTYYWKRPIPDTTESSEV